ncbi:YchJ family protein [Shewanella pealeana]|uniref:SEC-C motif domain protein n=1 Tax=Shewanella pealeana (strain ATCC 700345 / ANG-SQ1) TaxID=398579 RepID=A8H526_SHEPA|nr:YchJ family protein [Shewanella pealeana]ABV87663.1 SEC-C motif domain protein [Shewanella pealeana ATCC 700345]
MTNHNIEAESLCPCCSGLSYQSCCQPFHLKTQIAQNPEQLMRSRFSAFYLNKFAYLIETHHPDFLNGLTEQNLAQEPLPDWLGLEVKSASEDGNQGRVTFQAWYQLDNELDAIHECSDFIKLEGKWFYTKGEQKAAVFPKRNDKCVCNSGKKFKQCCGQ